MVESFGFKKGRGGARNGSFQLDRFDTRVTKAFWNTAVPASLPFEPATFTQHVWAHPELAVAHVCTRARAHASVGRPYVQTSLVWLIASLKIRDLYHVIWQCTKEYWYYCVVLSRSGRVCMWCAQIRLSIGASGCSNWHTSTRPRSASSSAAAAGKRPGADRSAAQGGAAMLRITLSRYTTRALYILYLRGQAEP